MQDDNKNKPPKILLDVNRSGSWWREKSNLPPQNRRDEDFYVFCNKAKKIRKGADKSEIISLFGPADYQINDNLLYYLADTKNFPGHRSDLFPGLEIKFGKDQKVEKIFNWVQASRDFE